MPTSAYRSQRLNACTYGKKEMPSHVLTGTFPGCQEQEIVPGIFHVCCHAHMRCGRDACRNITSVNTHATSEVPIRTKQMRGTGCTKISHPL